MNSLHIASTPRQMQFVPKQRFENNVLSQWLILCHLYTMTMINAQMFELVRRLCIHLNRVALCLQERHDSMSQIIVCEWYIVGKRGGRSRDSYVGEQDMCGLSYVSMHWISVKIFVSLSVKAILIYGMARLIVRGEGYFLFPFSLLFSYF